MYHLCSFYMWEIMHATIKKMNKHVTKLLKEVEEARDKLEASRRVSCSFHGCLYMKTQNLLQKVLPFKNY